MLPVIGPSGKGLMHCTLTAKGRESCVAWWWGAAGAEGGESPALRRAALHCAALRCRVPVGTEQGLAPTSKGKLHASAS